MFMSVSVICRQEMISHCAGDQYPLDHGKQTLLVTASISGSGGLFSAKTVVS